MRTALLFAGVLGIIGFTSAPQTAENPPTWLFPSDTELLKNAQIGFTSKKDLKREYVFQRTRGSLTLAEDRTGCRERLDSIEAAGPLMLAALSGRIAKKQAAVAPSKERVLEYRGEILLWISFFARSKEVEAQTSLWQDGQEYQPVSQHVVQNDGFQCDFHDVHPLVGTTPAVPAQVRYKIQQYYVWRFSPQSGKPEWDKPFKLVVRRTDSRIEDYESTIGPPLKRQDDEMR
jgi:hypothetical protein